MQSPFGDSPPNAQSFGLLALASVCPTLVTMDSVPDRPDAPSLTPLPRAGASIRISPDAYFAAPSERQAGGFKNWLADHSMAIGITAFAVVPGATGLIAAAHYRMELGDNRGSINAYLADPTADNQYEMTGFGVEVVQDLADEGPLPESIGANHGVGSAFLDGAAVPYGAYIAAGALAALGRLYTGPIRRRR